MDTGCTLTTITLGAPDVFGLATFYARLLGWDRRVRAGLRGATLAGFQPQDDVRVCLDPAGHPFCLWIDS